MQRTQVEIDALKRDAFAIPSHRKFPITDQDDLVFALAHADEWHNPEQVRRNAIKMARRLYLGIPDEYKDAYMSQKVEFGNIYGHAELMTNGWYKRDGVLFDVGVSHRDMNGKDFALPEDKADVTCSKFSEVELNWQHSPYDTELWNYMFDERPKLAAIKRVGDNIIGEVHVPAWFQEATKGKPIKWSSEWDTATCACEGAALCLEPAVKKAVFSEGKRHFAAQASAEFKDYSTKEREEMAKSHEAMDDGSYPIKTRQDVKNAVHDFGRGGSKESVKKHIIARAKAIGCEDALPDDWQDKKEKASMAAEDGKMHKDVADHHDRLVRTGAECSGVSKFSAKDKTAWDEARKVLMASGKHKIIQAMHDCCPSDYCDHYATSVDHYSYSEERKTGMGAWTDKVLAHFRKNRESGMAEDEALKDAADKAAEPEKTLVPEVKTVDFSAQIKEAVSGALSEIQTSFSKEIASFRDELKQRDEVIKSLQEKNAQDAESARYSANCTKIDGFKASGQIMPAEGETLRMLAKQFPDAFEKLSEDIAKKPTYAVFTDSNTTRIEPRPDGDPQVELSKKLKALMAANKGMTVAEAYSRLADEDRGLATKVAYSVKSQARDGKGDSN